MAQRRKSLSEKEIRTVLAVIESYREQNNYRYDEMNHHMGSLTIEEMLELNTKLKRWYNEETWDPEEDGDHYDEIVDEYEDVDMDEYRDSYSDYISSYIY